MINFVDIALQDANYLPEHDQLDAMLAEGWQIIGHSEYNDVEGDSYERYTLHRSDSPETQVISTAINLSDVSRLLLGRLQLFIADEIEEAASSHDDESNSDLPILTTLLLSVNEAISSVKENE